MTIFCLKLAVFSKPLLNVTQCVIFRPPSYSDRHSSQEEGILGRTADRKKELIHFLYKRGQNHNSL